MSVFIYMDRDADLHTPATTRTGSLDGMVVSHLTGRGAAELVRFWGEPPLVRDPDLALFGVQRLDPAEEELLSRSPLRRYLAVDIQRMGPAAAAQLAVERIHGLSSEFVLHLDVDVIADFEATDYPGSGGLSLDDVRAALKVFAVQKHLAALEVAGYHPGKDTDGKGASLILDLLEEALKLRLAALQGETPQSAPASASSASTVGAPEESGKAAPPAEASPSEAPTAEVPSSGESGDRAASGPVSGEALSSDSVEPSTGASEEHVLRWMRLQWIRQFLTKQRPQVEPMNLPRNLSKKSSTIRAVRRSKTPPPPSQPQLIIFDVDGVLVDVRGSFHRTTLETVRFFTGKRVTRAQLHDWKNRSGFNDDWKFSTAWVQSLGGKNEYDEVKSKFVELYWGREGSGNVSREKWLLSSAQLRRLAKRAELAIFTGRTRKELDHTLGAVSRSAIFHEHRHCRRRLSSQTQPRGPSQDSQRTRSSNRRLCGRQHR